MTNNLSQWLGKEGFLNQPKPDSNTPKTVPAPQTAPKSASTKPTTPPVHVQHNHNANQGKKPFVPTKGAPQRTFDLMQVQVSGLNLKIYVSVQHLNITEQDRALLLHQVSAALNACLLDNNA